MFLPHFWRHNRTMSLWVVKSDWIRPYSGECTPSRPIWEVKHQQAQLVLRWVTTGEAWVQVSFDFFQFLWFLLGSCTNFLLGKGLHVSTRSPWGDCGSGATEEQKRGEATNDYKSYSICTSLVSLETTHGSSISIPSQGSLFLKYKNLATAFCLCPEFFMLFLLEKLCFFLIFGGTTEPCHFGL